MRRFNLALSEGELFDLGLTHYGEFVCTPATAEELLDGGMVTVDGRPGRLWVIERFDNAVQMRWVFDQKVSDGDSGSSRSSGMTEQTIWKVVCE